MPLAVYVPSCTSQEHERTQLVITPLLIAVYAPLCTSTVHGGAEMTIFRGITRNR
jgi:hypothetical protein